MELRFVTPELARLDEIDSEVLACAVWRDARPSHGLAGLCDWRLAGRISELERRGLITGELGEVVLLPGKPRLTFDKLLLFGAGPRAAFDEEAFREIILRMLDTMEDLSTRASVVSSSLPRAVCAMQASASDTTPAMRSCSSALPRCTSTSRTSARAITRRPASPDMRRPPA